MGKASLYSRPGPHMWRLLLSERHYVPLPVSWHLWHLGVALVPTLGAWWLLERVRARLDMDRAARDLVLCALEHRHVAAAEAEAQSVAELTHQVARLSAELAQLRTDVDARAKHD